VDKVPTRGRETVRRRALTNDEVRRLLAVSGRRRVVYLAAVTTGLRRGELAAIEKGDLHLSGQKPYLKARASTTKNRKEAVIWLGEELAQELRRIVPADAHEDARVFESIPTMKEMRADLKAAGIPLLDERGYRVDFHALRHTYGTNLRLAGVDPRVTMECMRHSEIGLTMQRYTDVGQLPVAEAVAKLPRFLDGVKDTVGDTPELVLSGHSLSSDVTSTSGGNGNETPSNIGQSHSLSPTVAASRSAENGGERGIRTPRFPRRTLRNCKATHK